MDSLGWVEAPREWAEAVVRSGPAWFSALPWHEALATLAAAGVAVERARADVLRRHGATSMPAAAAAGEAGGAAGGTGRAVVTDTADAGQPQQQELVTVGVARTASAQERSWGGAQPPPAGAPSPAAWDGTGQAGAGGGGAARGAKQLSAAEGPGSGVQHQQQPRNRGGEAVVPHSRAEAALNGVQRLRQHVLQLLQARLGGSTAGALPQLAAAWASYGVPYDRDVMAVVLDATEVRSGWCLCQPAVALHTITCDGSVKPTCIK